LFLDLKSIKLFRISVVFIIIFIKYTSVQFAQGETRNQWLSAYPGRDTSVCESVNSTYLNKPSSY